MPNAVAEDAPRIIVFDLDGTLWNPEMYELWGSGGAPFRRDANDPDAMIDRAGTRVRLIGETRSVLQRLLTDPTWATTHLAISSTCDVPEWALELLQTFEFEDTANKRVTMAHIFGNLTEIYKANKAAHHKTILKKVSALDPSVTSLSQMLFFDNQRNNIRDVSNIGVACYYCPNGLTEGVFDKGLEIWRRQNAKM